MALFGLGMKMKDLKDLYVEQLRGLYSAEAQLTQALPKMADAASMPELKQGFLEHLSQTRQQMQRLESIFADLGEDPGGRICKAMQGLVAEGSDMIGEKAVPAVKDAGLIACGQRIAHYEIAGYGTVRTYAEVLGFGQHADLLATSEQEEKDTDQKLTQLSRQINVEAASA